MAKVVGKLSPLAVSRPMTKGMYHDGGGLYLRVKSDGGKSWSLRYMLHGKAREMGLGGFPAVSLADARKLAGDHRRLAISGQDPIEERSAADKARRLAKAKAKTFRECAEGYIDAHKAGWRNAKHAQQWTNTLASYAYPLIGHISIGDVDTSQVMSVLEQKHPLFEKGTILWLARPETASRLRGRIETILDWAKARGYRVGDNPARWRGLIQDMLPHRGKTQRVIHQPALPYDQVAAFMASLRKEQGLAARALEFVILTACRTSEVLGATWGEIDLSKGLWIIPAGRIKAGREHRVALSARAVELLQSLKAEQDGASLLVFPGQKPRKPLSNMAMLVLLRRMGRSDITVHGFRSSFRDWAAEQTNFPREVAEAALAHAVGDKVEAAYRRSDLFNKRRLMMEEWGRYCAIA